MTREEAIAFFEDMNECTYGNLEAVEMAISALSAEPCEDCRNCKEWDSCPCGKVGHENGTSKGYSIGECKDFQPVPCEDAISRQAVLDELEKWDWQELYLPIHFKQILDDVPSVENKGEWIPVSENPKEYDRYLTYHKDGKMYVGTWGLFGWNYGHYVEDVIAWMPLPEPYKAER